MELIALVSGLERSLQYYCFMHPMMHQSQIAQCTIFNRNVLLCAHFCYKMVHCGIVVYATQFIKYKVDYVDSLRPSDAYMWLAATHDLKQWWNIVN